MKEKIDNNQYKIVVIIYAETSTGVNNPVAEIRSFLKNTDTIYLVDGVTSLGGIKITLDNWGVDAFYSGSQKCLSCSLGLSPASFSEKAIEKLTKRKTKVPNGYLDLSMIMNYWEGKKRAYHHTAPINMLYGLYQALFLIFNEGLDNVYKRHLETHKQLVKGLENIGLEMFVDPEFRLPMLNSVKIPEGVDDNQIRSALLTEDKIEIGGGLGPLTGKVWRIGLMVHTARPANVEKFLNALKKWL